jgi:hypothetical protein
VLALRAPRSTFSQVKPFNEMLYMRPPRLHRVTITLIPDLTEQDTPVNKPTDPVETRRISCCMHFQTRPGGGGRVRKLCTLG